MVGAREREKKGKSCGRFARAVTHHRPRAAAPSSLLVVASDLRLAGSFRHRDGVHDQADGVGAVGAIAAAVRAMWRGVRPCWRGDAQVRRVPRRVVLRHGVPVRRVARAQGRVPASERRECGREWALGD